jgi:hypothetical protein
MYMSALSDWTTQGEVPVVDFWGGKRIRIRVESMCVIQYEPRGSQSTVVSQEIFDIISKNI